MTAFIATMNVKPGREAVFEALCKELSAQARREEPGLLAYEVVRHRDRPGRYAFYARFKDQADFEFHQQADFHQRLAPPILDCVEGEMDLQFFDRVA